MTITSAEFKTFFESYFAPGDALEGFDWDAWFHGPGMPVETPDFDRTLSSGSEALAAEWIAYDRSSSSSSPPGADISEWITNQTTCFLEAMLTTLDEEKAVLKATTTMKMDEVYGFSRTKNSEILNRFCKLAIGAEQASILPVVLRFITTQGRMKFVRPLYRALFASKMGKAAAIKTFQENRSFYHNIAVKMIATDMGLGDAGAAGASAAGEAGEGKGEGAVSSWRSGKAGATTTGAIVAAVAVSVVLGMVLMKKRR